MFPHCSSCLTMALIRSGKINRTKLAGLNDVGTKPKAIFNLCVVSTVQIKSIKRTEDINLQSIGDYNGHQN